MLSSVSWEAIGLATRNAFLGPDGDNWFRAMGILLGSGGVVILAWRWLRRGGHVVNWENPTTAFYRRLLDLLADVAFEQELTPRRLSHEAVRQAVKRLGSGWKRARGPGRPGAGGV